MAIDLDQVAIEGKREEYRRYIEEHVNNVKTVWEIILHRKELRDYINRYSNNTLNEEIISVNIENHDRSKYSEEEFEPYRKNFYYVNEEEKEKNLLDFQLAWQHHKDNNKHHWDYWHERHTIDDMPFVYVVEMFCDHAAMCIKFGSTAKEWFMDKLNKKEIHVGEKQKKWYLELADLYYSKLN